MITRIVSTIGLMLCLLVTSLPGQRPGSTAGTTYVIVHGAWGGSWAFRKVDSLLTSRGHLVYRPSLTGLGERVHLASKEIGLETHVMDVVNTLVFEELRDIVLVGHSYGGVVISGVAEHVPDRIRHLVYVDALVPEDGESMMTMFNGARFEPMIKDGFIVPPWVKPEQPLPKDVPHPLRTFTDSIRLKSEHARRIPATYILTVEGGAKEDQFSRFAERARARGWTVLTMQADHNPQWSAPEKLVELLAGVR